MSGEQQLSFNVSTTNKKPATTVVENIHPPPPTILELVEKYYYANPRDSPSGGHELEVKFGTLVKKAPLRRSDYDNVIKKLLSLGFTCKSNAGQYSLRIGTTIPSDRNNPSAGNRISNVRVEIDNFDEIQKYCRENNLGAVVKKFISKKPAGGVGIKSVDNWEFNFRVTYSTETEAPDQVKSSITSDWDRIMKTFRFINRVMFEHENYPFKVDVSIVKTSRNIDREQKFSPDAKEFKRGRKDPEMFLDTTSSGVFTAVEKYEIEIEVDNERIGVGTEFDTPAKLVTALNKVIKFVLSGIQKTNYPVKFTEQQNIRQEYYNLFTKEPDEKYKFVGPNPVTLQLDNIQEEFTEKIPNIRNEYVVTDKADGERSFLFVSAREKGKIYLISNDLDVTFTGVKTSNEALFKTLLDGELVTQNKQKQSVNIYLAFDLYLYHGVDKRKLPLISRQEEDESRYALLNYFLSNVQLESIIAGGKIHMELKPKLYFPIYPEVGRKIFLDGCKTVLDNSYDYETDGLIFTPAYLCVYGTFGEKGSCNKIPNNSMPWRSTFKWKPPASNTIDFYVETLKGPDGTDEILTNFSTGMDMERVEQGRLFKMIELKVSCRGINVHPCEAILRDKYEESFGNDTYPLTFVPSDPVDINAGRCKIELVDGQMMCEDGDIFKDMMIVEFSYNTLENQWKPLRVRHDKTNIMLKASRNRKYGNSYEVADNNWRSIHYEVKENMLKGDEASIVVSKNNVYYTNTDKNNEKSSLRKFHNYYKSKLINAVSKQSHGRVKTLIDYACGQGGDIKKWSEANIKFVLGIDLFEDNIGRMYDGACARYVNYVNSEKRKTTEKKMIMNAIFIQGDSSKNIKNGEAFGNNTTSKVILQTLFDEPHMSEERAKEIPGAYKSFRAAKDGFDISSCQFALHYFFKNIDTLTGFIKNLVQCTKLGGHFIGTAYDGKKVFSYLKQNKGQLVYDDEVSGDLLLSINSDYDDSSQDFMETNDLTSLGKQISVFAASIGQFISEYLINFEYFTGVMANFGFELISKQEASEMGLPRDSGGLGSFDYLLNQYKTKKSNNELEEYAKGFEEMSKTEKNISSLSMYFVYKKVRVVDPDTVIGTMMQHFQETQTVQEYEDEVEAVVESPKITKLPLEQILLTNDKEDIKIPKPRIKRGPKKEANEGGGKKNKNEIPTSFVVLDEDEDD